MKKSDYIKADAGDVDAISMKEISESIDAKQRKQDFINKCKRFHICPKCGGELEEEYVDLGLVNYLCNKCELSW